MAEFQEIRPETGFDDSATPRWQMVPINGSRYVLLRGGAGLSVTSASTYVVKVTETDRSALREVTARDDFQPGDRFFKLDAVGSNTNVATIVAKSSNNAPMAVLEVRTQKPRTIRVKPYLVVDKTGRRVKAEAARVQGMILESNSILTRQANVTLELHGSVGEAKVDRDLGDEVLVSDKDNSVIEAVFATATETGAYVNLFVVWRIKYEDGRSFIEGFAYGTGIGSGSIRERNVMIDERYLTTRTIAHEVCHKLGLQDIRVNAQRDNLMYNVGDERNGDIGNRLRKSQIITINPL